LGDARGPLADPDLPGWVAEDHPCFAAEGKQAAQADQGIVPAGSVQAVEHSQDVSVIDKLSDLGYEDFTTEEVTFAGRQGTRLEFVYRGGDRPERRSREYFTVRGPAVFCLGMGTYDWDVDKPVFDEIAARFELTPPP
jgi:hypothetical protein